MGMSSKGEISFLTNIVKPDVAVITNVGSMHIEYLGSREAIRDAKMEIAEGLDENGVLILNGDEPLLEGIEGAKYLSFDNPNSYARITNIRESEDGSSFDLIIDGKEIKELFVPVIGKHNVQNGAMAYLVGLCFDMTDEEIRRGLSNFKSENMRQNFIEYKDITILMDCYNAGPESTAASLEVLKSYCKRNGKRSVAVLGEMRELGEHADRLHFETGKKAADCAELLFTVGRSLLAEGACSNGMKGENITVLGDDCYSDAAYKISKKIKAGDCILFKASRSMKFENLIDELKKIY
jgi:UDP-N-acetylmuramoyl-tripeptide--D-alanyl-D-alanine ligase